MTDTKPTIEQPKATISEHVHSMSACSLPSRICQSASRNGPEGQADAGAGPE